METSLHRDLKSRYAHGNARFEVPLDSFRIDAISGGRLVEIQHGSLAAIRDKVRILLENHRVVVVKPIVVRKQLIKQASKDGPVVSRRQSPKCGSILDLFEDLVHFTGVFPHPRLTLEVPLVDIEEWRHPGHGRRRRWRADDHQVEDQKLLATIAPIAYAANDLLRLIACPLPQPFHTGHLAESLHVRRWVHRGSPIVFRRRALCATQESRETPRLYRFVAVRKAS